MSLMSALSVGVSGLKNSQNAINTTSHNLGNVNTDGYVRQQVVFADKAYITLSRGSVYYNQVGLGVDLAEVRRVRDELLDKAFRQENGREAFYERQLQATTEIEELFGELQGVTYQSYLEDFWEAIQEVAKTPSDTAVRSALVQSAVSFISKSNTIYQGLKDYQSTLDTAVKNMVDRINKIGAGIDALNKQISAVESVGIEKANDYRDQRDSLLDELSGLIKISYSEGEHGIVTVKAEGVLFVSSNSYYPMGVAQLDGDKDSLLSTPVWPHLNNNTVFNLNAVVSTLKNTDTGGLKGLLLARGCADANYMDIPDFRDYTDGALTDEYKAALERLASSMVKYDGETDAAFQTRVKTAQGAVDADIYNKAYQRALQDAENSVLKGLYTKEELYKKACNAAAVAIDRADYADDAAYDTAVEDAKAAVTMMTDAQAAAEYKAVVQALKDSIDADDYKGGRNCIAYEKALTTYREQIEQSSIRTVMAEVDQLVNAIVEKINDLLCPNTELLQSVTITLEDNSEIVLAAGTKVLDTVNAGYGQDDDNTQGTELFSRKYTERYETVTGYQKGSSIGQNADGYDIDMYGNLLNSDGYICELDENGDLQKKSVTYQVFNTKNVFGNESLYVLGNMSINNDVLQNYALIPLAMKNEQEDRPVAEMLGKIWELADLKLTPDHNTQKDFMEYYTEFTGQISNAGNLYEHMVKQQETLISGVEGERQGIMGVSSDEELTNLIKYQAAYNASSRYITVIDQMLEHLLTSL